MKVEKVVAVAFLVALGFKKAPSWEDEKILDRLKQAPEKVKAEDVPEEFKAFYQELGEAGDKVELVAELKKGSKPAKGKKEKKAKEEETEGGDEGKPGAEKDEYGCRVGTISAKVNAVLTGEWQSEEDVASAAGVTLDQARGRLYYAGEAGVLEHRRLVQVRLVPAKQLKKAA